MASVIPVYRRCRKNFSKIKEVLEISNLIEIQKRSYDQFLQVDVEPEKRESVGLQGVFKTVFPIKDFYETASLEFVNYRLTEPKYDVEECLLRGMTFAAPIKVTIRLVVWDVNPETEAKSIKAVKNKMVFRQPVGIFIWDRPTTESAVLHPLWLAKIAYPDRFSDIDMVGEIKKFYSEIMSFNLSDEQAKAVLAAKYTLNFMSGGQGREK